MGFEEDGRHVKSISVLAQWLTVLVDKTDNVILGVFPGTSPKEGIAYEKGEGDKFSSRINEICKADDVWYITLDAFHNCNPNNIAGNVTKQFLNELGVGKVNRESSLLRLLPFKQDSDSIEFISPPFHMSTKKGEIEVESFEMLNQLYEKYLNLEK